MMVVEKMIKTIRVMLIPNNVKIQFSDTHVKIEGFATSKKKNKQKIN